MFDLNAYLNDPENLLEQPSMKFLENILGVDLAKDITPSRRVRAIVCTDGLEMSVQAGSSHYCAPRSNDGPWSKVEVGYPSEIVEELLDYAENPQSPTETVYGYVPVDLVEEIVNRHGGVT